MLLLTYADWKFTKLNTAHETIEVGGSRSTFTRDFDMKCLVRITVLCRFCMREFMVIVSSLLMLLMPKLSDFRTLLSKLETLFVSANGRNLLIMFFRKVNMLKAVLTSAFKHQKVTKIVKLIIIICNNSPFDSLIVILLWSQPFPARLLKLVSWLEKQDGIKQSKRTLKTS